MNRLSIIRPDDWHLHLRDGAALASVVCHSAARFARAIVMPNLAPPVTTVGQALAYRKRILAALPAEADFEPLMTLYLTDETTPEEILRARECGHVHAIKLYPAGATTNSASGVTDTARVDGAFRAMGEAGLPLLVHGEVVDRDIDVFDRERVFIERVLAPIVARHPGLRIVLEHVTTRDAVDFVKSGPDTLAATITAHHLLLNRNAIFEGGLRPHHYCLPVLKREHHREALIEAATGDDSRFFLGTDSAPHARDAKEAACGCAGIYTAHAGIELYAEAFEAAGRLDVLEDFASRRGATFYRMPCSARRIELVRQPWRVPESYALGDGSLIPFRAGQEIPWRIEST